jgi:hypothetical protein
MTPQELRPCFVGQIEAISKATHTLQPIEIHWIAERPARIAREMSASQTSVT